MSRARSTTTSISVGLLLLAASLPVAASVPTAHGSFTFDGDEAFRGPLARALGVTGSGTASEPFVISGLSVPMAVYASPTLFSPNLVPAITVKNTHAHVRIEGNIFYGVKAATPENEIWGSRTAPAIVLAAADNVVIAGNVFHGVGHDVGTVSVSSSLNIDIVNNTFLGAIGPAITTAESSVVIENNFIDFVGQGAATIEVLNPAHGSRIARNVVEAWTNRLARALVVVSFEGSAPVDIVDNRIRGISGFSIIAHSSVPSLLFRGNVVEAQDCGILSARARLEANSFNNCSSGLSVEDAAISPDNLVNGGMMLSVTNQTSLVVDSTHPPIGWLSITDVEDVRISDFHAHHPLVTATIKNAATVEITNSTLPTYTHLEVKAHVVQITGSAFVSNRSAIEISANETKLHRVVAQGLTRGVVLAPVLDGRVRITESRLAGAIAVAAHTPSCQAVEIANSTLEGTSSAMLQSCEAVDVRHSSILGNFHAGASTLADARYNWWGHASGPSGSGLTGQGSWVSRGVLVDPWLTSAP